MILQFCSPATLAQCIRVSFAMAELASPLLYRHLEVVGLERLGRLFCSSVSDISTTPCAGAQLTAGSTSLFVTRSRLQSPRSCRSTKSALSPIPTSRLTRPVQQSHFPLCGPIDIRVRSKCAISS